MGAGGDGGGGRCILPGPGPTVCGGSGGGPAAGLAGRARRGLAAQLAEVASFPEQAIAQAARSSLRDAGRVLDRARTAQAMPPLGDALSAGTKPLRARRRHRTGLTATGTPPTAPVDGNGPNSWSTSPWGVHPRSCPGQWPSKCAPSNGTTPSPAWSANAEPPGYAAGSTARACGASPAALIPKPVSPSTAAWTPPSPPCTPTRSPTAAPMTPWNATASSALMPWCPTHGPGGARWRPEWSSWSTPPPPTRPHDRLGLPVELPTPILHRLFAVADLTPYRAPRRRPPRPRRTRPGTLHPPRQPGPTPHPPALHPTCVIPGCTTRYDLCKLHHIHWWEHGGHRPPQPPPPVRHPPPRRPRPALATNLTPNRQLTITYPDGTTTHTGPPRRQPDPSRGPMRGSTVTHPDPPITPLRT